MSLQTLKVLEAFLNDPTAELSGAGVQKRSGIASGTLYPILLRLESAGWVVSRWEAVDPVSVGRPRRRLYRLTPTENGTPVSSCYGYLIKFNLQ